MSDIMVSPLSAPASPLMPLDPLDLDDKQRHVSAIEESWGLPRLPPEVKLDLITQQDNDRDSLGEFLWGLASDINEAINPLAAKPAGAAEIVPAQGPSLVTPVPTIPAPGSIHIPQNPVEDRLRRIWHDLIQTRKPEVESRNAVVDLKRRAIDKGILDPSTPLDGTWTPELNSVRYELMSADAKERWAGDDRTGSISFSSAVDFIEHWTDPRRLLGVAVRMDFLPDIPEIGEEFSEWGDKWRKFAKAKGVVNKARSLLDAVTGPIDDIAVPIINDILLVTGVSGVIGGVRAAVGAGQAFQGARGLYATRMLAAPAARGFEQVAAQRAPSFLAGRFAASSRPALNKAAESMTAWRNLKGVKATSKGLQEGLKLGIIGQAEAEVFKGQEWTSDIEQFKYKPAFDSPLGAAFDILAIPFAPATIFTPGSISGRVSRLSEKLTQVALEARATTEVANAWGGLIKDPDRAAEFAKTARKHGPSRALIEYTGGEEEAGFLTTWATYLAAIDKKAVETADRVADRAADLPSWKAAYLRVRNANIAQLRSLDEDDVEGFLSIIGSTDKKKHARRWEKKLRSEDPLEAAQAREAMNNLIRDHNEKRNGVSQALLETLRPGDVELHVKRFFQNEDNWSAFLAANDQLRQLTRQEGWLDAPASMVDDAGKVVRNPDAPHYVEALSPNRRRLNLHPDDSLANEVLALAEEHPDMVSRSWFMPLAREIAPGKGRFALAGVDTVTKQDAVELLSLVKTTRRRIDSLRWLEDHPDEFRKVVGWLKGERKAGKSIGDMTDHEINSALREIFAQDMPLGGGNVLTQAPKVADNLKGAVRTLRHVARSGGGDILDQATLVRARTGLELQFEEIGNHRVWSDSFGISAPKMDDKIKQLTKLQHLLAAEIAGVPDNVAGALKNLGYKVVHGHEFLMPHDLLDVIRPFSEVSRREAMRVSLGTFLTPTPNRQLGRLVAAKFHNELTSTLIKMNRLDASAMAKAIDGDDPGEVAGVVNRLWEQVMRRQRAASEALEDAELETGVGGAAYRMFGNIRSSMAPLGLRELTLKDIATALPEFADDTKALAEIRKAILRSYDIGFRYNGLQSIEDYLLAHGALGSALRVLSKTTAGGNIARTSAGGAVALGALSGGLTAAGGGDLDEIAGATLGGAVHGAVGGGLAGAAGKGAKWALARDHSWHKYTGLSADLVRLRNHARFTLSPFFDLSRYSEGAVLAQTQKLGISPVTGKPITLPVRGGIKQLRKDFGEQAVNEARAMWKAATKGEYGVIDEAEIYFRQKGIMGFSPMDWMAATNYRLVKQGVAPDVAHETVMKIYNYGLGRSAAEKSVNFVFFPFSFSKKYWSSMARYMSEDLSRTLVLQDSLKLYELLDDHYDLGERLERHMPILDQVDRLNSLAFGINPGMFGGINRPILNLFLPQVFAIGGDGKPKERIELLKKLVPAINDVQHLWEDMLEQGHVAFSPAHLTSRAEVDAGYTEWNQIKDTFDRIAKEQGYEKGWLSILRDPDLAQIKQIVDFEKAKLSEKYPAWAAHRAEVAEKRVRDLDDINMLFHTGWGSQELASDVREFMAVLDEVQAHAGQVGISIVNNPEDVPPLVFDIVREKALELALRDRGFDDVYRRYFMRTWGPLWEEV